MSTKPKRPTKSDIPEGIYWPDEEFLNTPQRVVNNKKQSYICGVCKERIDGNDAFAYPFDATKPWRHKKCGPGSKVWKAVHGESAISKMLTRTKKRSPAAILERRPHKDTIKAIKEFAGRDKYMRYMDTTATNPITWIISAEISGNRLESSNNNPPLDRNQIYKNITGEEVNFPW